MFLLVHRETVRHRYVLPDEISSRTGTLYVPCVSEQCAYFLVVFFLSLALVVYTF